MSSSDSSWSCHLESLTPEDEEVELGEQALALSIEDTLSLDLEKEKDLVKLQAGVFISDHLRTLFKTSQDLSPILPSLRWIIELSKHFRLKLGLSEIRHKETDQESELIPRSSYKFCNNNFKCPFNYKEETHKGCFAQHYVYNLVEADALALYSASSTLPLPLSSGAKREIEKCLNTLHFVFSHMQDELRNVSFLYSLPIETLHVERTPTRRKKKKIRVVKRL